jgi:hypothetical protein
MHCATFAVNHGHRMQHECQHQCATVLPRAACTRPSSCGVTPAHPPHLQADITELQVPLRLYKQLQMMLEQQPDASSTAPDATTHSTHSTLQQQAQQEGHPDQPPEGQLALDAASMAWQTSLPLLSPTEALLQQQAGSPVQGHESAASDTAQPADLPADIMARRAPRIRQGRGPGHLAKTTQRLRQAPYTIKPGQMSAALAQEMEAFSRFSTTRWAPRCWPYGRGAGSMVELGHAWHWQPAEHASIRQRDQQQKQQGTSGTGSSSVSQQSEWRTCGACCLQAWQFLGHTPHRP